MSRSRNSALFLQRTVRIVDENVIEKSILFSLMKLINCVIFPYLSEPMISKKFKN